MTRVGWLLVALLSVLLIVGWYFLVFSPTSEDIEDVRAQTEQVRSQTEQQFARAEALRAVRQDAPESESALAAGQMLIPEAASIPALFRQLQQSSDDAGVRLMSISPGAPSVQEIDGSDVAVISVSMAVTGTYFQVVDLARRIEDPLLTPRALRWVSASLSPSEFPELSVTLSGQVFARGTEALPTFGEPEPEADEADEADEGDEVEIDPDDELEVDP